MTLHVDMVSLDSVKAFSRIWTPLVLRELPECGSIGNMFAFVNKNGSGRTVQVLLGSNASDEFLEETDAPQVSVLAVTLFLVAMDGVFGVLFANVYLFVYADAILFVLVGGTPGRTSYSRHPLAGPATKLGTEAVPNRKITRVLEVDIDRKLTHEPHEVFRKEAPHQ